MNENVFRFSAIAIFVAGAAVSIYFRRKADRDTGEKVSAKDEGRAMFLVLRLGGLVLWFSLIAYLINPAWMAWSKVGLTDWMRWLGVGIGVVSDFLIFWLFHSIGTNISPTVATRREHQLINSGPYRWVRHPLYSVGTLFFLSFAAMADSWFLALLAVIAFVLLAMRTPNEEAHLIEKFGDAYRDYMKHTGRFLPRVGSSTKNEKRMVV
jgi:protein-S-isoprenylcysteine O-methyltransferase Ste14